MISPKYVKCEAAANSNVRDTPRTMCSLSFELKRYRKNDSMSHYTATPFLGSHMPNASDRKILSNDSEMVVVRYTLRHIHLPSQSSLSLKPST